MYVREYLHFHALIYQVKKETIEKIIKEVGLSSHASKKIKELSKGYKQRLGLAVALLHEPDVLILDEPTTGLDPNQLVEIRSLIKKVGKNKTVLFSTHIMQEVVAVCDRVIIINKGKIVINQSLTDLHSAKAQIIEVEFDQKIEESFFDSLQDFNKYIKKQDLIYEIYFNGNKDHRASIFDLAQQNNLKILSMSQNTQDLEKLFQDLTR
jgi:ABC-2 type transport system ATP-binding protein